MLLYVFPFPSPVTGFPSCLALVPTACPARVKPFRFTGVTSADSTVPSQRGQYDLHRHSLTGVGPDGRSGCQRLTAGVQAAAEHRGKLTAEEDVVRRLW